MMVLEICYASFVYRMDDARLQTLPEKCEKVFEQSSTAHQVYEGRAQFILSAGIYPNLESM